MKTFEELGLKNDFVKTLEKASITEPSEIQEKTIPLAVAGRDIIGGSATGSGKTLAFASGIIENLQKNHKVQALVLTPTRELAEQVSESISKFGKHKNIKTLAIYGGVNIQNQIKLIGNADVVVGTPGRILDHLDRRTLDLGNIKFLVLDEVDRMFDMGFQVDVQKIINECPKERQTMLFSATISPDVDYLANKYTQKPAEVSVKSHIDPSKLKQIYYDVPDGLKFSLFVHLLKKEKGNLVMTFCGTRRNVDFVVDNLKNLGIKAGAIHGGMEQNKRTRVLNEFNSNKGVDILVCTDVAARGLDIKDVSHVYNYDLPKTSSEYIHRIGRTARAGKEGIAINVLCSRDYENFSNVQRDDKLKITEMPLPKVERVRIIIKDRKDFGDRNRSGGFRPRNSEFGRNNRSSEGRNFNRRDDKPRSGRSFGRNDSSSNKRSFGKPVSRGSSFNKRDDKPRSERSFGNKSNSFSRGRPDNNKKRTFTRNSSDDRKRTFTREKPDARKRTFTRNGSDDRKKTFTKGRSDDTRKTFTKRKPSEKKPRTFRGKTSDGKRPIKKPFYKSRKE